MSARLTGGKLENRKIESIHRVEQPTGDRVPLAYTPAQPERLQDLGVPESLALDLFLNYVYKHGVTRLSALSRTLKLSIPVAETMFRQLTKQQIVEVKGMEGEDYLFALTAAGRTLATERSQNSRYCGPMPVSITEYCRVVKEQAAEVAVDSESMTEAFSDLIVTHELIEQLGPAAISQNPMLLYGPAGTGKTSLAERLLRLYHDYIVIPYAVEVDGHVVVLYDPVVHRAVEYEDADLDPRWVVCRRPSISVGGELVPSMLDLQLDASSGVYAAPLQMKANNGILIVDDFGRQVISPRELLNRWIVPLDRRVDYLALDYGMKFQIPFELMVVFSTNLAPAELADEAFLRRMRNKIFVGPVEAETFDQIFERVVAAKKLPCQPGSAFHLRQLCLARGSGDLRPCVPNDICNIIVSISKYKKLTPQINPLQLERAVNLYFGSGELKTSSGTFKVAGPLANVEDPHPRPVRESFKIDVAHAMPLSSAPLPLQISV